MKALFIIVMLLAALFAYGCTSLDGSGGAVPSANGSGSNASACNASAGYAWCGPQQKCLLGGAAACTGAAAPAACTKEARICPDGSSVARTGADCEFALCPPGNYTLYGWIVIGPLCPAEPCSAAFDYRGARVNVYNAAGKGIYAQANASQKGFYGLALIPGDYTVNVTNSSGSQFGLPGLDYTQKISIEKGRAYEMDFSIDTGIR